MATTEPKIYNLQITEKQARALKEATDLLMRLQLGQWQRITDHLPLQKSIDHNAFHRHIDRIGKVLRYYLIDGIDGNCSSLGVGHRALPESNGILYDLNCVIRRQLAVEQAVEQGVIKSENVPRSEMPPSVDFNIPYHWGTEPLAKIERGFNEKA